MPGPGTSRPAAALALAIASDEYDPDGKLLRSLFALPAYDYQSGAPFTVPYIACDFSSGAYFLAFFPGPHSGLHYVDSWPESTWSPDSLAGAGVR
jgi:hypothetical protein